MLTKSQQLIYKIVEQSGTVKTKIKLAKLQYLTDFMHYAFNSAFISGEGTVYSRQEKGPLANTLSDDIEALELNELILQPRPYTYAPNKNKKIDINLSPDELYTINYVLDRYGKLPADDLVRISHEQEPYLSSVDSGIIEPFTAYNLIDEHEQEYKSVPSIS